MEPPTPATTPSTWEQNPSLDCHLPQASRSAREPLEAHRVAALLGLNVAELAVLIRHDPVDLMARPDSPAAQGAPQAAEQFIVNLQAYFGSLETSEHWLSAPQAALGQETPITRLRRGDLNTVQKLLAMAQCGTPT